MNEFEKREQDRLEFGKTNLALVFVFLFVVFRLGYDFLDIDDDFYEGESLSTLNLIVDETPRLIEEGFFGTDRYTLKITGLESRFWIANGALEAIKSSKENYNLLKQISQGDTIQVSIYSDYKAKINQRAIRLFVIELYWKKNEILNRFQTRRFDYDRLRLDLIGETAVAVILLIWMGADAIKRRAWW